MEKIKRNVINILSVFGVAIVAILVHALLPSPGASLDVSEFDGVLVKKIGFPASASIYFLLLYLHIMIIINLFAAKSIINNKEIGIRYGIAFGLMYLVGMQEVVVVSSPLDTYGLGFITYQLFMGLGDAIPVVILCYLVSCKVKKKLACKNEKIKYALKRSLIELAIIAIIFFLERMLGYMVGYIDSDIGDYPVPVLVWTLIFGFVLGAMFIIIRPIYNGENDVKKVLQVMVLSIGVNWIWFNCFIGIIMDGMFIKMFIRGLIDVIIITVASLVTNLLIKGKNKG